MNKTLCAAAGVVLLAASAAAFQVNAQETAPPEAAAPAAPATPAEPAATASPAEPAAPAPKTTAAAPVYGELGKPAPGKGQVVFFRQSKLMGAALSFKVRENDVELGKLSNGVYFVLDVDPGLHEFVVHSEAKDVTPIEVEAGEVYYLSFSISIGVIAGRPNLSPSTQAAFDALSGKIKPSKWAPEPAKP